MRAMMAIGMVPSAIAGRIRCRNASTEGVPLERDQRRRGVDPETKSRNARGIPRVPPGPTPRRGDDDDAGLRRPDGGRANGVPLSTIANTNASQAEHEHRSGDADVGQHHGADVGLGVAAIGGEDAQRDAHADREDERVEPSARSWSGALDDQVGDGLIGLDGVAQVPRCHLPEVGHELDREWLVEAEADLEQAALLGVAARRGAWHGLPGRTRASTNTRNTIPIGPGCWQGCVG